MTESPGGPPPAVGPPAGSGPVSARWPTQLPVAFSDPLYVAAVADLLGAIAYGELSAFERLSEDAKMAPSLRDKAELARMASTEFAHFEGLSARLTELALDPFEAMSAFVAPFEDFHRRTAPADWHEGLVKAYVGDGLAADFYREIAAYLDADTRDLILATLDDTGHSGFVVDRVRRAIEDDPKIAGRLALWARRLMGEALSQAHRVAGERDALTTLLVGGVDRPGMDLAAAGRLFARLAETHIARMESLGLQA
jgi:tRNA-(MS[2]IO[6]A)-hydroxylase (MiaE)-like